MAKLIFIWGAGGAGKTHIALRQALRQPTTESHLMTLDPSERLFHLLKVPTNTTSESAMVAQKKLYLSKPNFERLWDSVHQQKPDPRAKNYYQRLIFSLPRFREYLSLIELSAEASSLKEPLIVDTPPFYEAMDITRSMQLLQRFFSNSLLKWSSLRMIGKRGLLEVAKHFVGPVSAADTIHFLEWLSDHQESFQKFSAHIEKDLFSDFTEHHLVVTPETTSNTWAEMMKFTQPFKNRKLIINKSVQSLSFEDAPHPLRDELMAKLKLEQNLRRAASLESFSLGVETITLKAMGSDAASELEEFCQL